MTTVDRVAPLSARQRDKLRTRLTSDQIDVQNTVDALLLELESFQASRRDTTTDDGQDPEGPALDFERSQATVVLNQSRSHLQEIGKAIRRLDEGSYGVCQRCNEQIPFARLEARPYSAYCVTCAD
jgi:RNA polymerase-binding transcription factor DksA